MTTVTEHTEGSYEVQDVQFGKVYKWRPENVVVRCECGERATLTGLRPPADGAVRTMPPRSKKRWTPGS